jgi:hypothetical protein
MRIKVTKKTERKKEKQKERKKERKTERKKECLIRKGYYKEGGSKPQILTKSRPAITYFQME